MPDQPVSPPPADEVPQLPRDIFFTEKHDPRRDPPTLWQRLIAALKRQK